MRHTDQDFSNQPDQPVAARVGHGETGWQAPWTLETSVGEWLSRPVDLMVLFHWEDEPVADKLAEINQRLDGALADAIARGEFSGKARQWWSALTLGRLMARRILVVGLGRRAQLTLREVRMAMGDAAQRIEAFKAGTVLVVPPNLSGQAQGQSFDAAAVGQALAEGALLGAWRFPGYKRDGKPALAVDLRFYCDQPDAAFEAGLHRGQMVATAQNLVRALGEEPSNRLFPQLLAEAAYNHATAHGLAVEIFDEHKLEELGMGALLAVGSGSAYPPRMVVIRYQGGGRRTLALVGKGITFDSGGISLKPAESMEEMKYDMLGAAAVLGAMLVVAQTKPRLNVIGILCLAQNIPSGTSYKPGDVVRAFNGKTIEITNTDAEGRVALADGVSYAAHLGADWIAEASTLTGAAIIALGHEASALVATDDRLAERLLAAAERAGERTWRLPAYPEYRALYESRVADLKNAPGRDAGSITAGMIVAEFAEAVPFAHLDIAGTAWTKEGPLNAQFGPTGVGVRTFVELVQLLESEAES